jgi:hypothetical protein
MEIQCGPSDDLLFRDCSWSIFSLFSLHPSTATSAVQIEQQPALFDGTLMIHATQSYHA